MATRGLKSSDPKVGTNRRIGASSMEKRTPGRRRSVFRCACRKDHRHPSDRRTSYSVMETLFWSRHGRKISTTPLDYYRA